MAIAAKLKSFLEKNHVEYDMVKHVHSSTALEFAHADHVPSHQMAQAVVLEYRKGDIVSVMPSTNRVELEWANETLGRNLEMDAEDELLNLFHDCELGAVPAFSNAYGLDVIWE